MNNDKPQKMPRKNKTSEEKQIERMLKNGIESHIIKEKNQQDTSKTEYEALRNITSEYLNDFLIIGHNIHGQRVIIHNALTPAQLDSLTSLCRSTILKILNEEEAGPRIM